MLGENIKTLRKQKGYSQETLASQLNVVRQTISKWEKGQSVPDAYMLEQIAELFEVPVSDLLGNIVTEENTFSRDDEIVTQLAILNAQLANQARSRRRTIKIAVISILSIFLAMIVIYFGALILFRTVTQTDKYDDAKVLMAQIEDYFRDRGGEYEIVWEE